MKTSYPSWVLPVVAAAGAVFGALVITAVFISQTPQTNRSSVTGTSGVVPTVQAPSGETTSTDVTATSTADVQTTSTAITVDWYQKGVEIPRSKMFDLLKHATDEQKLKSMLAVKPEDPSPNGDDGFIGVQQLWKQGDVHGGAYDGGAVYVIDLFGYQPFGENRFQFVLSKDGSLVGSIDRGGDEKQAQGQSLLSSIGLISTDSLTVADAIAPALLHIHGREVKLAASVGYYEVDPIQNNVRVMKAVATSDEGIVFHDSSQPGSCLISVFAGGYVVHYNATLPFKEGAKQNGNPMIGLLDVDWIDGYANTNEYLGQVFGGCMTGGDCANTVSAKDVGPESNLMLIGTERTTGDRLYAPKDPVSHPLVQKAYDMWYVPGDQKPTIREMIAQMKVPIFFWKDPAGRWVEFGEQSLIPQAECGKPVIYLYPELTTNVRVALPSTIHVTVSEPQYATSGWMTTAEPNGQLTVNGKTYGSLYWEGTGVSYQPPKTGFVVKDGDVDTFFAKTLPKYGLNQKEAQEFRDFWTPKMTGVSKFYRISFLTSEWSNAAPLSVSPLPKTSIRLFMDWAPLSKKVTIPAPRITTPVRTGFTLVEWGGTLYQ